MTILIDKSDAKRLIQKLLNAPIAPGRDSYFINVGTEPIIDALDQNYFRGDLADGIGCFKYLEGDYGSGKTQFINSLAQRAAENDVVTAIVTVGAAVASAIAVAMKVRTLCVALLDETAHGGQFLAAQLFLGVGVHQSALSALGICL